MFLDFSHRMQGLHTMDPSLGEPLVNTVIGRQGLSSLPGGQRQPGCRTDRNTAPDPDREPGGQVMGHHPDKTPTKGTGQEAGCNTHCYVISLPVFLTCHGSLRVYGSNDAKWIKKNPPFHFLLVKKTLSASWNQMRFILCLFIVQSVVENYFVIFIS
jgi:hypothetical protein